MADPIAPFTQDYINQQQASGQWKTNPYQPGTLQHNDFEKARVDALYQGAGAPTHPEFNSNIDPSTGLLKGNLALSDSSGWAKLMKQQLADQQTSRLGANAAQAQGANAAAESQLAMRGGLGSGARTSLAKDTARNIDQGAQGINKDISNQGLGVDIQQQQNALGAQQYNIGNALGENTQQRAYDANNYNQQMQAFGAMKTGQAMQGGGKGK